MKSELCGNLLREQFFEWGGVDGGPPGNTLRCTCTFSFTPTDGLPQQEVQGSETLEEAQPALGSAFPNVAVLCERDQRMPQSVVLCIMCLAIPGVWALLSGRTSVAKFVTVVVSLGGGADCDWITPDSLFLV